MQGGGSFKNMTSKGHAPNRPDPAVAGDGRGPDEKGSGADGPPAFVSHMGAEPGRDAYDEGKEACAERLLVVKGRMGRYVSAYDGEAACEGCDEPCADARARGGGKGPGGGGEAGHTEGTAEGTDKGRGKRKVKPPKFSNRIIKNPILAEVFSWAMHIVVALLIGLFIVVFVVQRTVVDKWSMEPTLHAGDNLWVEKLSPRFGWLGRGDIVTIYLPEELPNNDEVIIKRIIAVGGDHIRIAEGRVYVNGEMLDEPYVNGQQTRVQIGHERNADMTVPDGCIYVMGDNRGNSLDSRSFGAVERSRVTGKAGFRFYPFGRMGFV